MKHCKECGSYAINQHCHGREAGVDLDLCDVCYWRKRAGTWFAIKHDGGDVVATGASYREVSDAAFAAMPWGGNPAGEVAPYYLTTLAPA